MEASNLEVKTDLSELERASGVRLRAGILGRELTTMGVGGPVQVLAEPRNVDELRHLTRFLSRERLSFRVLGAGSNTLISEQGVREVVIRLGTGFGETKLLQGDRYRVGARVSLMSLSRRACEEGLSGLEFAGGIPASVGGAVFMNAGAHGTEMASVIEAIELCTGEGEQVVVSPDSVRFSYRRSELPRGSIVTGVIVKLVRGEGQRIRDLRQRFLRERRLTQPLALPSAGSVFKNPTGFQSAGWLIEQVGLKGLSLGGAQVSAVHANWIVNPERKATADDVDLLIERCRRAVHGAYAVSLELEVQRWGYSE